MHRHFCLLGLLCSSVIGASASAGTIRVPQHQPTIGAAIVAASDGDTIEVAPGTYAENIDFLGKSVRVYAPSGATIAGTGGAVVVFIRGEDATSELVGFTITGGTGVDIGGVTYGGGVYCLDASPTIVDCRFTDNTASEGGGVYAGGSLSEPEIRRCIFENNTADSGSAIHLEDCRSGLVSRCTIRANHATSVAAVMFHRVVDGRIEACTIEDNTAGHAAGAIYLLRTRVTVDGCTLARNTCSDRNGGAALIESAEVNFIDCAFHDNRAGSFGGAVHAAEQSSVWFLSCEFTENVSSGGAAIYADGCHTVESLDSTFERNRVTEIAYAPTGGTVVADDAQFVVITDCEFRDNTTESSGGAVAVWGGTARILRSVFENNDAVLFGGAISAGGTELRVEAARLRDNCAREGGSISNYGSQLQVIGAVIDGNDATLGGGIHTQFGSTTMIGCTVADNSATQRSGGVHVWSGSLLMVNCIVWGNTDPAEDEIYLRDADAVIRSCVVRGGWAGDNLDIDPGFVNASLADYHLRLDSPCLDIGDGGVGVLPDFDGDIGALDGDGDGVAAVDIGGDELAVDVAARFGGVGAGSGSIEPVLFVNGSAGDGRRRSFIDRHAPILIEMRTPVAGPDPARFVLYAFAEHPDASTLAPQPFGLGLATFPTPLNRRTPQQVVTTLNNLGFEHRLGAPDAPSSPAPSILVEQPRAATFPPRITLQGFIEDVASGAAYPASLTNALVLEFVD